MMNFTGLARSRQTFQVFLKRKSCANANQNARARVEYVKASDWREAKQIALALPHNSAFVADGQPKEVR